MIETASPAILAVAPPILFVIELPNPDMRTVNGFACSACDTEQEIIIVEDFYGSKKERTHRR